MNIIEKMIALAVILIAMPGAVLAQSTIIEELDSYVQPDWNRYLEGPIPGNHAGNGYSDDGLLESA